MQAMPEGTRPETLLSEAMPDIGDSLSTVEFVMKLETILNDNGVDVDSEKLADSVMDALAIPGEITPAILAQHLHGQRNNFVRKMSNIDQV